MMNSNVDSDFDMVPLRGMLSRESCFLFEVSGMKNCVCRLLKCLCRVFSCFDCLGDFSVGGRLVFRFNYYFWNTSGPDDCDGSDLAGMKALMIEVKGNL